MPFDIKGTDLSECPVSYITPQSYELVQIYARTKQIGGEHGSISLFGPDLTKWPSRMADVFCLLETERVKVESARIDTDLRRSKHATQS